MADVKPLKLNSGIISQMGSGDTLPVANGGTGATTLTAHGVLLGNGTGVIAASAAGTAGQPFISGGASADGAYASSFIGATTVVQKTAGETVTSSNTLQNDDHLTFAVAANETWKGIITFSLNANGSGGFKFDIAAPSGASGSCAMFGNNAYTISWVAIGTGGGATQSTTNIMYNITFTITNGANAGNVTLRWAQNASFGTGTTINSGATLIATRTA